MGSVTGSQVNSGRLNGERGASAAAAGGTIGNLPMAPAAAQCVVVISTTPIFFPMGGYTRAAILPSTTSEGVRVAQGASAASELSDPYVMTPAGKVISETEGFWLRRSGSNDCTVSLELGN